MPPVHDDAICLRHREWSETSQTVTLLTRAHGLVHGLAKGSLREKAPYSGGFEHLQLGELGFINKPDRDLLLLTEWDLVNPFPPLRADYRAATIAMFAGELTASLLAPLDPHPEVFASLGSMLAALPGAQASDAPAHAAAYLHALLTDTGHAAPPPDREPASPDELWAYDPRDGAFRPDPSRSLPVDDPFEPGPPAGVWHLRGDTLLVLGALAGGDAGAPGDPHAVTRAARFLAAWACYRAARRPASLGAFLRVTRN